MEQGLIHIYCGDGKGKTSAAIGLAVRAAGSGLKVLFTRFLKNESSGELAILDDISQIKVLHLEKSYGFFKNLSEEKKQEVRETYLRLWRAIELEILTGRYDVLVIDEFMAAYKYDLIPKEEAIEFLEKKPKELEIVLTGRNPDEKLVELADYVSEIKKVKHPFDQGIYANIDEGNRKNKIGTSDGIYDRKLCGSGGKSGSRDVIVGRRDSPGETADAEGH